MLNFRIIIKKIRASFLGRKKHENKSYFLQTLNSNGAFEYDDSGFEIIEGNYFRVEWKEIIKMTAYKKDLITLDEICLFVECDNGKNFEISEQDEGWFQFLKRTKYIFNSINPRWEMEIAVPAFERKETIIYSRDNSIN